MYEFEAAYHYGPTEDYNAGRGIQMMSEDLQHIQAMFDVRKVEPAPYALRVRDMGTGKVICEHRSIEDAHRAMTAAYHRRRAAHS